MANHDQPRMVSKFGNDTDQYREISSKMLSTFVLSMRGTAFYFSGDELGMSNIRFNSIKEYNDVDAKNKYQHLVETNGDLKAFLEDRKQTSRDNSRTPFQWNDETNTGFTTGKPWLKINQNYKYINATAQEKDSKSTLNYFKKLVKLRKNNPVLVYGSFNLIDKENPNVFAYTRELKGKKMLIILNFSNINASLKTDIDIKKAKVLLNNYTTTSTELLPYQAIIYQLK